jgi:DNA-binding response OmpR family regulator
MPRLLIVEDSPTQAQQLQYLLRNANHEVEVAANGVQALRAMERKLPDLVVTDLEMPEMNGLQLVEAIRARYAGVPVIVMTAYGSEDTAAMALRKGAASYVPKRYLAEDIVPTIEKILSLKSAEEQGQRVREVLRHTEFEFTLNNDETIISSLIGYLEGTITRMTICDQTGLIQLCVALREALVNAMHHGNLEVGSEYREDETSYQEVIRQRQHLEPYRDRHVYLNARISREKAEFIVRDEGPGFDPSILPDPTDPANLAKVSGRGLLLIRTFMDQVYHNAEGNEITFIKRCV